MAARPLVAVVGSISVASISWQHKLTLMNTDHAQTWFLASSSFHPLDDSREKMLLLSPLDMKENGAKESLTFPRVHSNAVNGPHHELGKGQ